MNTELSDFDRKMIALFMDRLHSLGCAVVVFMPEELNGADYDRVEEKMVETGWDVVDNYNVNYDE